MSTSQEFGEALRAARKAAGLSMADLGRALSKSTTFISDVERGKRNPLTFEDNVLAARILSTDVSYLTQLAAQSRGRINIAVDRPKVIQVIYELARVAEIVDAKDLDEILSILGKTSKTLI